MKVRGPNGLVLDVPETVGRSMVAAGHVETVPVVEGMKLDQILEDDQPPTDVEAIPEADEEPLAAPETTKPQAKRTRRKPAEQASFD
jgi:hypothetical protein